MFSGLSRLLALVIFSLFVPFFVPWTLAAEGGAPKLSIDAVRVKEGDSGTTEAKFTVSLSAPAQAIVTVDYATADGAATLRDHDYVASNGTLTFMPGESSHTISVVVNGDLHPEGDEDFSVQLTNPRNATLAQSQGRATILDDDGRANLIILDDTWLSRKNGSPYLLDQPGKTYVLHNNLRTPGTAFVVGAAHVTLDLNGHTVIYGDDNPMTVINGGFEEGEGSKVPGWDLSGAPSASLARNTTLLFGKQVLRLNKFNTSQKIVSAPQTIPRAGQSYTATITPAGVKARSKVHLSVIDDVTGEVLAKGTSAQTARGFSALASFTPRTTHAVRLQVEVDPPTGATDTVDLDEATLTRAGDYGVFASRSWGGDIPGFANLPPAATKIYRKAAHLTVKNGVLEQGKARSYASSPLFCRRLPGLTVENVETHATGMDTLSLEATFASEAVTVRKSVFREDVSNISNRMRNFATLKLNDVKGTIIVEDNKLLGSPQMGMMLAANDPKYRVLIRNNEFRANAVVTNSYAIVMSGIQNFEISGNTIQPQCGKGIDLDGYARGTLGNGEVHHNTVETQERANREYPSSLESVALRLRNTVDAMGPHRNLKIHHNTFAAHTSGGMVGQAYGVRISYTNKKSDMKEANIVLSENTFKAIVTTKDLSYRAKAMVIDHMEPDVDLRIINNVLESNDIGLALTDTSGNVEAAELISNTFKKTTEGGDRPYTAILGGYYIRQINNVRILDPRFAGGATMKLVWSGTGTKTVSLGSLLSVKVVDGSEQPVKGAMVQVLDRQGQVIYKGTTGETGMLANVAILTKVYRQTTTDPKKMTTEEHTPLVLSVSANGMSSRQPLAVTGNAEVTVRLR